MDARRRLSNLQLLVREAQNLEDDGGLSPIELLQFWMDRMCLTGQDEVIPDEGQVALMTVHNSKGLEYPVVFVTQMIEGLFPHAKSVDTKSGIEEERRLAYVAFTRAQQFLVVTWSNTAVFWTSGGAFGRRPAVPSRFLFGIPPEVCVGNLPIRRSVPDPNTGLPAKQVALNTFLKNRKTDEQREMPNAHHTLIDVESLEQLKPGVQILHPRKGMGEIRGLRGTGPSLRLLVAFGGRAPTLLSLHGVPIQIVIDS